MAFDPRNPEKPSDLYATFDMGKALNGLIYSSEEGMFTRINGNWAPLSEEINPLADGAFVAYVDPAFIDEFDARMAYNEFVSLKYVTDKYGVDPMLPKPPAKK